jgi:hypothetical protein
VLQSASVAGRSAVRQRKARRVQRLGGRTFKAARHRWHRTVRPRPPTRPAASPRGQAATDEGGIGSSRWTPWSLLLWRVFDVNGVACPACGRVMALRAVVRRPVRKTGDAERSGVARTVGTRPAGPPASEMHVA